MVPLISISDGFYQPRAQWCTILPCHFSSSSYSQNASLDRYPWKCDFKISIFIGYIPRGDQSHCAIFSSMSCSLTTPGIGSTSKLGCEKLCSRAPNLILRIFGQNANARLHFSNPHTCPSQYNRDQWCCRSTVRYYYVCGGNQLAVRINIALF